MAAELPVRGFTQALFDFDGTLSTLRQGWEEVMIPLMVEEISAGRPDPEIEAEVREYVDRSTGILTIRQMEWLAGAVQRHQRQARVRSAADYKALYLARLMESVDRRLDDLFNGRVDPERHLLAGATAFVHALAARGVRLHLASGTDHEHVVREAQALGLADCFEGRIYGALDGNEAHAKERIIHDLLQEIPPEELLVAGDGPVELREAAQRGVFALGVCSDEVQRSGWNTHKLRRLAEAGANLLIPDFAGWPRLLPLFAPAGGGYPRNGGD